jgi:hypothetical protein
VTSLVVPAALPPAYKTTAPPRLLSRVLDRVMLGRFFGVVFCLQVMTVRQMSVVAGPFVITRFVMLGGGQMVFGRLLMMLGCLTMIDSTWILALRFNPLYSHEQRVLQRLRA